MLSPDRLHPYQNAAVAHILSHPASMLWLDMGLGKTIITLSAIVSLNQLGLGGGTLIVAPLRPAKVVWEREARRWTHTRHLTFSYLLGSAKQREAALFLPADIFIINYENLAWLEKVMGQHFLTKDLRSLRKGRSLPFDTVVFDEVTMLKNSTAGRTKAVKHLRPFVSRSVGLTGTPAANGLKDLHGQYLVVDGGQRLGVNKGEFTSAFFRQAGPYKLEMREQAWDVVRARVSDITLEMSAADYLTLPAFTTNDVYVDLNGARGQYEALESDFFAQLDNGAEIEVFNRAALSNKLRQFANGAVYSDPEKRTEWQPVHGAKLEALGEIVDETGDEPLFLTYQFKHDWDRIKARYPEAETLSGTTPAQTQRILDRFAGGGLKLLCGHPRSAGHGIDGIQDVCRHIISFGLGWDGEAETQAFGRVMRQGQKRHVIHHRILARDTVDDLVRIALETKVSTQADFRRAVAEYRKQKSEGGL